MTKNEELREEIALEKQIFFVLFAAGIAILGWLFTNGLRVELVYSIIAVLTLMIDAVCAAFLFRRIKSKIKELGKLP